MNDIAKKSIIIAERQKILYDVGYLTGYEEGFFDSGDPDAAYQQGVTDGKQEANAGTVQLLEQFNAALDMVIEEENRLLLMTFKISGEDCIGVYGCRWGDWIGTDYNIYGITQESEYIVDSHGNRLTLGGEVQCDTDRIVMNAEYITLQDGDGNE